jgi:DNA-binding NarL/FixJ family response regulator
MNRTKVLIVEDEVIVSMNLKQQLLRFGLDVLPPVGNGEKAISVSRSEKPDVLILDIGLTSKMNGIEAARKIREIYNPLFIFTSGYMNERYNEEMRALNALIFYKPFDPKEIADSIRKTLSP